MDHFADDSNQMDLSEDEQTRGKDSKGKEIAGISRRRTRPQLNFLAILADYKLADYKLTLGASSREELCKKLYDGVYLKPRRLKYFVDKESNKNCFVLFARELSIIHGDNLAHWQWITEKEASGEVIEVAELLGVWWLDITGNIRTIDLSPGTMYEIVFVVKKMDRYSNLSFDLILRPQHSNLLAYSASLEQKTSGKWFETQSASLEQKPSGKWFEILVDELMMSPECVGNMEFTLRNHDLNYSKAGLAVKCAIVRPKK